MVRISEDDTTWTRSRSFPVHTCGKYVSAPCTNDGIKSIKPRPVSTRASRRVVALLVFCLVLVEAQAGEFEPLPTLSQAGGGWCEHSPALDLSMCCGPAAGGGARQYRTHKRRLALAVACWLREGAPCGKTSKSGVGSWGQVGQSR